MAICFFDLRLVAKYLLPVQNQEALPDIWDKRVAVGPIDVDGTSFLDLEKTMKCRVAAFLVSVVVAAKTGNDAASCDEGLTKNTERLPANSFSLRVILQDAISLFIPLGRFLALCDTRLQHNFVV